MADLIDRDALLEVFAVLPEEATYKILGYEIMKVKDVIQIIKGIPKVQLEDGQRVKELVSPHKNYERLSEYWCECGWFLGKKGEFAYCPNCGREIDWHA